MKKILIILLLTPLLLGIFSCEKTSKTGKKAIARSVQENQYDPSKPLSWGHLQKIYTFMDNTNRKEMEYILKSTLERKFYTVENEPLFEMMPANIMQLENYYRFKNLLFLCDTSSNEPVSDYVKKMMNQEMRDHIAKNKVGIFVKHNLWANDQFIIFIVADSPLHLKNYTYFRSNPIFYYYKEKLASRFAFQNNKNQPLPESTFKTFPFTLRIPNSYVIYKNDSANRFISFLWRSKQDEEKNPDKYIAVYYEHAEKDPISKDWVINTRNKVFGQYYDGDKITTNDVQHAYYKKKQRKTWIMSGRWQNEKFYMGGTFQNFSFYNEQTKTVYMIDTSVYFPAGYKLKYILELEGLAQTFNYKQEAK